MENPFKYGTVVSGKDFVDREVELAELYREVSSGKSVVLYSNRRMGKSSLLAELSRLRSKDLVFVRLDLYGMTDKKQLMKAIIEKTTAAAYGPLRRITTELADLTRNLRLGLSLSNRGEVTVQLTEAEHQFESPEGILDFPEAVSKRRKRRVVVILDEFQEIASLDGAGLLKLMRSRFQVQERVAYIFSGSKRHLLHQMFEEREGAFFKFARPMELGPIPAVEFEAFIVSRFRSAGGKISRDAARAILDITKGHPYYTQQVAHELYDLTRTPSERDVPLAVSMAVEHQSPAYTTIWESLKSPLHRRYMMGVVGPHSHRYGFEFIDRNRLKTASNVQRVESQLTSRGILDRGEIADPMFAEWLRRLKSERT